MLCGRRKEELNFFAVSSHPEDFSYKPQAYFSPQPETTACYAAKLKLKVTLLKLPYFR